MELNGGRAVDGNRAGVHPFSVFPEELWGLIGEKLNDSREIFNLIAALPEVEGVLEAKKRCWLFDQVIPHLSLCLAQRDILTCRQVCKQWSHAVDNLLEQHPLCRAYDHDNPVTGQIWNIEGRPTDFYGRILVETCYFRDQEEIMGFLQIMGDPPGRWRNPFMYRVINIDSSQDMQVVAGASGIFERYGQHLWYVAVVDMVHEDPQPFCHALRNWLDQLSNLKALRLILPTLRFGGEGQVEDALDDDEEEEEANSDLSGEDDSEPDEEAEEAPDGEPEGEDDEIANLLVAEEIWNVEEAAQEGPGEIPPPPAEEYLEIWKEPLPPLPYLETLVICSTDFPLPVLNALVASYSRQIRRLDLHICHWKPTFYTAFPQLTQLVLGISSSMELNYLLLLLQAPLLYSLELSLMEGCILEMGIDIFPWLRRFPLIRNLVFNYDAMVIGDNDLFSPAACSIPSLKYLHAGKQFLHANSDFLLCFPNLEYLNIGHTEEQGLLDEPALEPTVIIWDQLKNVRVQCLGTPPEAQGDQCHQR